MKRAFIDTERFTYDGDGLFVQEFMKFMITNVHLQKDINQLVG